MIVDRWKHILLDASQSEYFVSESYAALTAILAWVLQRIRTNQDDQSPATHAAIEVKQMLEQQSAIDFYRTAKAAIPKSVEKDFGSFNALGFLKWLRDGLCHGDASTVTPVNKGQALKGFRIRRLAQGDNQIRTLRLTPSMMQDTGAALATLYCNALALSTLSGVRQWPVTIEG